MPRPVVYSGNSAETVKGRRIKALYDEHGWKIFVPRNTLAEEDKTKNGRGLRCFRMRWVRDENRKKTGEKVRCKNPCVKGSLFCKRHRGANSFALVHGKQSSEHIYKGAFQTNTSLLFDAFLRDPAITDLKPELAALKTALNNYMSRLSHGVPRKSKELLHIMKETIMDPGLPSYEKVRAIVELCSIQGCLTDGESLDRMARLIESIGRLTERIRRIQARDEFMLTPDGIKILFRCLIDVIKKHVPEDKIDGMKKDLLDISIRTKGDLRLYSENMG